MLIIPALARLSPAGLRPAVTALFVVSSIVKGNPPLMKYSKGNFHMAAGSLCLFHMCLQRSGGGETHTEFVSRALVGRRDGKNTKIKFYKASVSGER